MRTRVTWPLALTGVLLCTWLVFPVDASAGEPEAPGPDEEAGVGPRVFRYAFIVDTNSYTVEQSDLRKVARVIRSKLFERTGVRARMVDRVDVALTNAQRESLEALQDVMDSYVLDNLARDLNGLVLLAAHSNALLFGGFQLNSSDLSAAGYCNAYDSPVSSGERVYGSVMDWEHRFGQCGPDAPTDPVTCDATSVPAGSGFCSNQASECAWNEDGEYCMCAIFDLLPYTDAATFLGSLMIHEWMHSFGKYGNFDHYCSQIPGSENDCVDEMIARAAPLECGLPFLEFQLASQVSCGICPYTFDQFASSHRICP